MSLMRTVLKALSRLMNVKIKASNASESLGIPSLPKGNPQMG